MRRREALLARAPAGRRASRCSCAIVAVLGCAFRPELTRFGAWFVDRFGARRDARRHRRSPTAPLPDTSAVLSAHRDRGRATRDAVVFGACSSARSSAASPASTLARFVAARSRFLRARIAGAAAHARADDRRRGCARRAGPRSGDASCLSAYSHRSAWRAARCASRDGRTRCSRVMRIPAPRASRTPSSPSLGAWMRPRDRALTRDRVARLVAMRPESRRAVAIRPDRDTACILQFIFPRDSVALSRSLAAADCDGSRSI